MGAATVVVMAASRGAQVKFRTQTYYPPGRREMHGNARIVVAGASGLIGSALVPALVRAGHDVVRLVRRDAGPGEVPWNPLAGQLDPAAIDGAHVVINLSGEGIADGRWSAARKRALVESRVATTGLLANTIAQVAQPPGAFVSVSAVGYYGNRGDEVLDDSSPRGHGFLAELAGRWEEAAGPARGVARISHPRLGLVLSPRGGALPRMLLPFRLGLGGPLGNGRQWMNPASIDDTVAMIMTAAFDDGLSGSFNATGPEPVTNAIFTGVLASVLRRPAVLPVPAAVLRLAFGEMADEAILASQRVVPSTLLERGFTWQHPTLEAALRHVLGRGPEA